MSKVVDLTGQIFGRLTVIALAYIKHHAYWLCRCECDTEKIISASSLRLGKTKSCGCLLRETSSERARNRNEFQAGSSNRNFRHGHNIQSGSSPTYRTWSNMMSRCTNPNTPHWKDYGGRGIKVCARWYAFLAFLEDMGERPEGKTLDRFPDKNGNYESGNCRWATPEEQIHNRRKYGVLARFTVEELTAEIEQRKGQFDGVTTTVAAN